VRSLIAQNLYSFSLYYPMPSTAILLAAGSGQRMQDCAPDKVLAPLCGVPAFVYSVRAFLGAGCIDHISVVYRDTAQREQLETSLNGLDLGAVTLDWVLGGGQRQDSVKNALAVQSAGC
jgi:2-C-methyl-D-erythritol 4-phosphate cytidylyltransferase